MFKLTQITRNKYIRYSTTKLTPHTYCHACGTKYIKLDWPRNCHSCLNETYRNPEPVVVGIVPVQDNKDNVGILLTQRAIKPCFGGNCLPGGFMEFETWQQAVSREIFEETTIQTDPTEFKLLDVKSTPDLSKLLIFGMTNKIRTIKDMETFIPNNEVSKLLIGNSTTNLCFPLHEEFYSQQIASLNSKTE